MTYIFDPGNNAEDVSFRRAASYPDKLLSLGDYHLPDNIKRVFKLCKYFALTSDIIGPAINKLAESPITDFEYNTSDEKVRDEYRSVIEEQLKLRAKLLGACYDLSVYGNSFLSLYQKRQRYLRCPICKKGNKGKRYKVDAIDWEFKKYNFHGKCPSCKQIVDFIREDRLLNTSKSLKILRWDPIRIDIDYYPLVDKKVYYYNISQSDYRRIIAGDREYLYDIPWEFVMAAKNNRKIRLNPENLYHFYTTTISNAYDGWGIPRMLNVFKSLFYLQTLLRANEAVSLGRINDMVVLYPEMNRNNIGPIETIGGGPWMDEMQRLINNFKKDPNHIGITGFPIGYQSIFGNGRQLLITAEMEMVIRNILSGMGVTTDMIYATSNYSSMAVSNRMLANQLNLSRSRINEFLRFLVTRLNSIQPTRYPKITIELSEYQTVDDLQETGMLIQLLGQQNVSLDTVLTRFKKSFKEELKKMQEEEKALGGLNERRAKTTAYAQGEAGMVGANYQSQQQSMLMKSQQQVAGFGGSPGRAVDGSASAQGGGIEQQAFEIAQKLYSMPVENREAALQEIQQSEPTVAAYVAQALNQLYAAYGNPLVEGNGAPGEEVVGSKDREKVPTGAGQL